MSKIDAKILLIAGEVSGDHHGGALVNELKKSLSGLRVFGIGGDELAAQGMDVMYHISQMAFLGIGEVIRHLPFIRKVMREVLDRAGREKPDAAVLIDYPGFNLKIAAGLHKRGIPVIYYISPQLWAWGRRRVKKIRKYVDQMLVLFPFEKKFYQRYGIDAECVGHPLVDKHYNALPKTDRIVQPGRIRLGLLPGSRKQEVDGLLPLMIEAARALRSEGKIQQAEVLRVNNLPAEDYQKWLLSGDDFITIRTGALKDCLPQYDAVVVASGTATLETGFFAIPMVIAYRVNALTYWLGRILIKVPYIGLVNIVAERQVAVELIQHQCTATNIADEIKKLLQPETNLKIRSMLKIIRQKLGEPGVSHRAAWEIQRFLQELKR